MKKKYKFLAVFILMFPLILSVSYAAPKSGQGNDKNSTSQINMDLYKSTYKHKVFSVSGSSVNTILNTTINQVDSNSSTETWEANNSSWKEIYSYFHNEDGKFFAGYTAYNFDTNLNDYVVTGVKEFSPPVKIFPKGQIDPYYTWGGVYSFISKDKIGNIIDSENQWREYRFCGYEDVTVPFGTFKNAMKVRRMRINGGLSNYWYVPEIGLIKSEHIWRDTNPNLNFMDIYELVSASY